MFTSITAFLEYFVSNADILNELLQKCENSIITISNQLIVLSIVKEVQLAADVAEKHPDVGRRVMNCICNVIDDEISIINHSLQSLDQLNSNLQKLHRKVEIDMPKTEWNQIPSSLVSPCIEIVEWIGECWKYFHLIYLNISNAVNIFHHDIITSKKWFELVLEFVNDYKMRVFNHPIKNMFTLFSKEISSDEMKLLVKVNDRSMK